MRALTIENSIPRIVFEVFSEGNVAESHVFREVGEAERWLAARRSSGRLD